MGFPRVNGFPWVKSRVIPSKRLARNPDDYQPRREKLNRLSPGPNKALNQQEQRDAAWLVASGNWGNVPRGPGNLPKKPSFRPTENHQKLDF